MSTWCGNLLFRIYVLKWESEELELISSCSKEEKNLRPHNGRLAPKPGDRAHGPGPPDMFALNTFDNIINGDAELVKETLGRLHNATIDIISNQKDSVGSLWEA